MISASQLALFLQIFSNSNMVRITDLFSRLIIQAQDTAHHPGLQNTSTAQLLKPKILQGFSILNVSPSFAV